MDMIKAKKLFVCFFILSYTLFFYKICFSKNICDTCPLKELCDETSIESDVMLCHDERFEKYFDQISGKAKNEALKMISTELAKYTAEITLKLSTTEIDIQHGSSLSNDKEVIK